MTAMQILGLPHINCVSNLTVAIAGLQTTHNTQSSSAADALTVRTGGEETVREVSF